VSPLLTGGDVATGVVIYGDVVEIYGELVVIYGDLLGIQW
jgi:hypothetical protein